MRPSLSTLLGDRLLVSDGGADYDMPSAAAIADIEVVGL